MASELMPFDSFAGVRYKEPTGSYVRFMGMILENRCTPDTSEDYKVYAYTTEPHVILIFCSPSS